MKLRENISCAALFCSLANCTMDFEFSQMFTQRVISGYFYENNCSILVIIMV